MNNSSLFQSARFKLTLFYLAIILALSITLSFGTRWLAEREYERSNISQRSAFRGAVSRVLGINLQYPNSADVFSFQHREELRVRSKLNEYVLLINLGALVVGGIGSYLFAGWTLKPIEEAHDAQRRFASDASHELRTPLTTIKAENEVFLRQKEFTKPEAKALIQSNLEEVDRLERLATDLLSLTKYEQTALKQERLNAKDLADSAVKQIKKTYPNAKIEEKVSSGAIMGNRSSLEQLLAIILDNANKYGNGKKIEVFGRSEGNTYSISVRDHGPGILPDDLPYVFDRLYRGDKARASSVPGHGLGLALAKRIAVANRGEITAGNASGGGAILTITLNKSSPRTRG